MILINIFEMFSDVYVLCGLTYSIYGNYLIRNHYDKVEELNGKTNIYIIRKLENVVVIKPIYFSPFKSNTIMFPVGGGGRTKESDFINILCNKGRNININDFTYEIKDMSFSNYYINTIENYNMFFNKLNINTSSFPMHMPLKVYERQISRPIFYNEYYACISKKNLISKTRFRNRLPLSLTILASSSFFLLGDWYDYWNDNGYYGIYEKPIFHPYRYYDKIKRFYNNM